MSGIGADERSMWQEGVSWTDRETRGSGQPPSSVVVVVVCSTYVTSSPKVWSQDRLRKLLSGRLPQDQWWQ